VQFERFDHMAGWNKSAGSKAAGKSKMPAKKVSHVTVEKGASGGHIVTHHHTHPDVHPDEKHVTSDDQAMMAHMMAPQGADMSNAPAQAGAPPAAGGDPAMAGAAPQAGAPPMPAGQ
jgi:hypothetical protein